MVMTPFSVQNQTLDGGDTEQDIKERDRMDLSATPAGSHAFASVDDNMKTIITPQLHQRFKSTIQNNRESSTFWDNYENRKKTQEQYKTLSKFYLTSSLLTRKDKTKNQSYGNQVLEKVIRGKSNSVRRDILTSQVSHPDESIEVEKNCFQKKFAGPGKVKETIKKMSSTHFKMNLRNKHKQYRIKERPYRNTYQIFENQSESIGYFHHLKHN